MGNKLAVTVDEKDERIKGTRHASAAAARDIPVSQHKAKVWRVRLTVTLKQAVTEEVIRKLVAVVHHDYGEAKVTRIREVA